MRPIAPSPYRVWRIFLLVSNRAAAIDLDAKSLFSLGPIKLRLGSTVREAPASRDVAMSLDRRFPIVGRFMELCFATRERRGLHSHEDRGNDQRLVLGAAELGARPERS